VLKTLSIVAGLISIGSLCTVASESEQVAQDRSSQSPDGSGCFGLVEKVAFTTTRDNPTFVPIQNAAEVYLMNPDGSDPQRITENEVGDTFPVLSPDGTKIVFMCRYGGTDFEICTINPDGSGLVQITNNAVQELSIRWSMDGTQFWFNRPLSGAGSMELFRINVDGTGETQMTNTDGINLFPTAGWLRVKTECELFDFYGSSEGVTAARRTAAPRTAAASGGNGSVRPKVSGR
jgi:Tol biopolymer transport system component